MDANDDIIAFFSQFPNLIFHNDLIDDIVAFCNKVNEATKNELFLSLHTRLTFLNSLGYKAALSSGDNFKKMGDAKGLSRLSLSVKNFNLRVIYTEKGKYELLIYFFDEKSGKKKTDYYLANNIAFKRLKQLG